MTLFSGSELREFMNNPDIPLAGRLIIAPILNKEAQIDDGAASIDVRLGSFFLTPVRSKLSSLDPLLKEYINETLKQAEETYVEIGEAFILHPRQFVVGITLEWIRLPLGMGAYVIGRSSWGREGLVIATATGVQPGFSGVLILELTNVGEIPISLYPGATIAQLFFHGLSKPVPQPAYSAFNAQTKPNRVNPIKEHDREIIERFAANRKKRKT